MPKFTVIQREIYTFRREFEADSAKEADEIMRKTPMVAEDCTEISVTADIYPVPYGVSGNTADFESAE